MAERRVSGQERVARWALWLLLAAVAISLAFWSWRLFLQVAPAPASRIAAPPVVFDADALRAQGWFGAGAAAAPTSSGRYVLRWVYPGRPGVCILALPGLKDRAFRIGEEVEPGLVLREVGRDYVVLEGAAGTERIQMPAKPPPMTQLPVTQPPTSSPTEPATAGAPANNPNADGFAPRKP